MTDALWRHGVSFFFGRSRTDAPDRTGSVRHAVFMASYWSAGEPVGSAGARGLPDDAQGRVGKESA